MENVSCMTHHKKREEAIILSDLRCSAGLKEMIYIVCPLSPMQRV